MAQETLKITITADNKQALEGLQQTSVATTQLSSNLGKLPSASNQANQALLNSGRVLQDLNYGFMGVANNLNPLLESFQRLGERSKEAGSSIGKELVGQFVRHFWSSLAPRFIIHFTLQTPLTSAMLKGQIHRPVEGSLLKV
jgi:hypothetical protein